MTGQGHDPGKAAFFSSDQCPQKDLAVSNQQLCLPPAAERMETGW